MLHKSWVIEILSSQNIITSTTAAAILFLKGVTEWLFLGGGSEMHGESGKRCLSIALPDERKIGFRNGELLFCFTNLVAIRAQTGCKSCILVCIQDVVHYRQERLVQRLGMRRVLYRRLVQLLRHGA